MNSSHSELKESEKESEVQKNSANIAALDQITSEVKDINALNSFRSRLKMLEKEKLLTPYTRDALVRVAIATNNNTAINSFVNTLIEFRDHGILEPAYCEAVIQVAIAAKTNTAINAFRNACTELKPPARLFDKEILTDLHDFSKRDKKKEVDYRDFAIFFQKSAEKKRIEEEKKQRDATTTLAQGLRSKNSPISTLPVDIAGHIAGFYTKKSAAKLKEGLKNRENHHNSFKKKKGS